MKNNKGITLIAVIITVIVILILSAVTIYETNMSTMRSNKNMLLADIDMLNEKILLYYNKYNQIPTTDRGITIEGEIYKEIDLNKLDDVTITYGKEYKGTETLEKDKSDVYVVSYGEKGLNIFYLKGVNYDNKIYYEKADF